MTRKRKSAATPDAAADADTDPKADAATVQRRRKPGAQPGNASALKHGLFSKAAAAKRRKAEYRRAAEAEGDAILAELGMADSATAQRIVRRMVQCETESGLLEKFCENRGRTDNRSGQLKPAYARLLDLRHHDLADCRRLLDALRDSRGDIAPGDVTYRVCIDRPTGKRCEACGQPLAEPVVLPADFAGGSAPDHRTPEEIERFEEWSAEVRQYEVKRGQERASESTAPPQRTIPGPETDSPQASSAAPGRATAASRPARGRSLGGVHLGESANTSSGPLGPPRWRDK